ncbi:alpha/beta hydrolase [Mycobacterium sp. 852002-40037_SCH5390672]|uniref:alpha/beta hydrolase n=1 Tax=Mycobacterium sp. 852002-40037_SCH5390672 TaxID=1834089 RepID=UPI0009EE2BB1|nr:alpha/beta hydrolase [Mycobacterium sp. 852002-40037_SCH5390672]
MGALTRAAAVAVAVIVPPAVAACAHAASPPAASPPVASPSGAPAPAAPSPSGAKPTIVLVHGAFADASSWGGEVGALEKDGYEARAIANPLENLDSDTGYVKNFLATLNGPIVLVGHSYGGSVITNAAAGNPNVKALVFVDAAAPDVGETTAQLSGADSVLNRPQSELFDPVLPPGAPQDQAQLYLKKDIFLQHFGNDLPPDLATRAWASQRSAAVAALYAPSKNAAWKDIPSWYFISSGDQVITPSSEDSMAARAHSQVTHFHGGSHLTLVTHPDAVTQVIEAAAASVH